MRRDESSPNAFIQNLDFTFRAANDQLRPPAAWISDLRDEAAGGTQAVRHFHTRLQELEEQHYRKWQLDRSMSKAVALLKFYWGGAFDPSRAVEVFNTTEASGGGEEHSFFTIMRSLWTMARGDDLSGSIEVLQMFAESYVDWKAEVEGFVICLNASFDRMPANWDRNLTD